MTVTDNAGSTATASVSIGQPSAVGVSVSGNNPTFGNNDGSATASASGGTPGYTYSWSNGGIGATISNLGAGTYSVTATDANGCTATGSITLVESAPQLSVSISSSSDVSCNGGTDGSATASASGGTPGYSYNWSNGANGATASGLSAGSYSVTVTDNAGSTAFTSVTISQPSALSVSTSTTNASHGGADGTATASASGGTPGYTYNWSNGGSGATISGLAPGTYTVTATDANGCTATASAVVNEDPPAGGCTYSTIDSEGFESGWGIWNDGGSDCRRSSNDAPYANTGIYCIRLRDNTSSSVMTTDLLDLTSYDEITVAFSYIVINFNNSSEDFWLQVSDNGGSSYTTVEEWNLNDEFQNGERKYDTIVIQGPFTANSLIRFRCDASGNGDRLYIDDVEISGCSTSGQGGSSALPVAGENGKENTGSGKGLDMQGFRPPAEEKTDLSLLLYPNPTRSMLQVQLDLPEAGLLQLQVLSIQGQPVMQRELELDRGRQQFSLHVEGLPAGQYLLQLQSAQQRSVHSFVIIR